MIWNERDTPRATTRCGGRPVMTAPSKRASPPSAGSSPVTTLKSVVLPAPLGPMTDRSSPRPTPNEAPSTAARPPKNFVTPSTSSSGRPWSRVTGASAAADGVGARASAGAGVVAPRRKPRTRCTTPTMPLGENMTKAMKMTPK